MDYTTRQRYRARRQKVERRRLLVLALCGLLVVVLSAGVALQRMLEQRRDVSQAIRTIPTINNQATAQAQPTARSAATAVVAPAPQPNAPSTTAAPFFDPQRLMYEPSFYAPQTQAFLETQPGPLKNLSFAVGDRQHTFAEVLTGQTIYSGVNPKIVLALLELQSKALSTPEPSPEQLAWAMGYRGENGNRRGLIAQVRWARGQLMIGKRDFPRYAPLTYADNSSVAAPPGMSFSEYVVARAIAPTTTPDRLPSLLQEFLGTYIALFGDPRPAPTDWPGPAEPFLIRPMERVAQVTSFFDHDAPMLSRDPSGAVVTYWGRAEVDIAFAYDGHDGWDYALAPPDMALAAADGDVVFAGNADDNCATRAVVLDHGNGYRTLYWHLDRVDVEIGVRVSAGQPIGMIGNSGCSYGPHLHFGVQYLGRNIDPHGWCGGDTPDPWAAHPAGVASSWLWTDRPSPCGPPPAGAIVVDTDSPGFAAGGANWQPNPVGAGGGSLFVQSVRGADSARPWDVRSLVEPSVAVYRPELPAAGRYRVIAYVPYALNGLIDTTRARYHVQYSGGEAEVVVDAQVYANDWVDLGTYEFDPADSPLVTVSNFAEDEQRGVWADTVMWIPVEER